jgi:hypothetical protein
MSGEQASEQERQELEELKRQMGTSNVAPFDTLGFGRRFVEIISRIGNVRKRRPTPTKKKNKQV